MQTWRCSINQDNKPVVVVVDGSSYLFRAYYALPPLTNSKGQPTGAILGVINMLKKLVNTYNPNWMVIVFDSKQATNRHELFPQYKQNRVQMPADLASQISPLLEIIKALGFSVIQIPGLEADDIIGNLVVKAQNNNIFSIVSTGDKDLAQLVNDDVVLINTMTDLLLDHQGVIEKFKIPPSLIVDYLVLTGDQVDNIPGVLNVGPKTAVKWLNKYKSLVELVKHIDEISGKVGDNLRAAVKDFPLYKQLVTIDTNVKVDVEIKDFVIKNRDEQKLKLLFTELEMNSWLKEIVQHKHQNKEQDKVPVEHNTMLLEQQSSTTLLADWINKIDLSSVFAIHLQTTSVHPFDAKIIGIHLATNQDGCYFSLPDFDTIIKDKETDNYNDLIKLLSFLQNPNKTKICYDLKFLSRVLNNYAFEVVPPFFDVTLEAYVLNSLIKTGLNLDNIDANQILSLHNNLWPQICQIPQLEGVLLNIEIPLLMVLKKMEQIGVLINAHKLAKQGIVINKQIETFEQMAYELAGVKFNLNSPKQLQEILYDNLGLPILHKTPTGQPSTSEQVLQELALEFELPTVILQYRTLSKLQSTYIDKLPKNINENTGRVHTCYNQTVTATGRLSSSDPNLQNIPIRTPEGRSIREAFVARRGYKILSADYSQIELRILAHLSQDLGLIKAFEQNLDIHTITASEVFHMDPKHVTKEERRKAKAINFGLIYGMSDFGLAKQLKISRAEATGYINTYFAKFPKVLVFMEETRVFAKNNGFVETMFGRRLYLPEINSNNGLRRKAAQRAAINAPMQGAQADIIKLAMINIDKWISEEEPEIFMLMQIHDELIFEVPSYKIEIARTKITHIMQTAATLRVALQVDVGYGDNWSEAH